MPDNNMDIPDTIKFLYDKPVNSEAIQIIIERKEPPKDSTWEELYEFYTAQLAAQKTQYDYWCFHKKIFEIVWQEKLSQLDYFKEASMDYYDGDNSLTNIWENDEFYKYYTNRNDEEFKFGSMISEDGLQLYCWFEKNEYQSNNWELSNKWDFYPEENVGYTKEKMIPIIGEKTINLQPLQEAVDEVINIMDKMENS